MATIKYQRQPILLLPKQKNWLNKESIKLTKKNGRYVSMSEVVRSMIDAHQHTKNEVV